MEPTNPFRPTFGAPPLYWVGREVILDSFRAALDAGPGAVGRSLVISGSRGIGKTVLLNELEESAQQRGWIALRASGRSNVVDELVDTVIPYRINELSPQPQRRIKQIGVGKIANVGFESPDGPPYKHNLTTRLRELLGHLTGSGVLLSIDEAQDIGTDDLTAIAVAYQDLVRDDMEVAMVVAGLPQGIDTLLDLPGATFLRRAERYVLGPLSAEKTATALTATAAGSGREFEPAARDAAVQLSGGYPYLVQLVGSLAWLAARDRGADRITAEDVAAICERAVEMMGTQVHQPAIKALSAAPREFLKTMAKVSRAADEPARALLAAADALGPVAKIADIADSMGRSVRSLSATRQRLIDADLIEPAGHGQLTFVLPYLREYLTSRDSRGRVS